MAILTEAPSTDVPLIAAVKEGDAEAVAAALKEEQPPHVAASAVPLAAKLGHLAVVEALLAASFKSAGTTGKGGTGGWSAAMFAAANGHTDVLAMLITLEGASCLAAAEGSSMTPLLLAALKGHTACAALILDNAADAIEAADASGRNALHLAASGGSEAMIELLVQRGLKVDSASRDGKTALMWAVIGHHPAAVGALCRLGADLALRDAPKADAPIIPGKNRDLGDSALDLAQARRDKDPTLRHIHKYLRELEAARAETADAVAPPMPPLPWVAHAEAWVAAGGDAAPAEEAAATGAPAAAAESDIFGDDDLEEDEPADEVAEEDEAGSDGGKGAATAAMVAVSAADLDDLD